MADNVADLMNQGRSLREQRRWEEAVARYGEVVKLDPDNVEAYRESAEIFAIMGKVKFVGQVYAALMERLISNGIYDEAIKVANRILELSPDDDRVRLRIINMYNDMGDVEEVVRRSRELARLYIELEEGGKSIDLLRMAIEADPSNNDIARELAEMLVQHGDIKEGAAQYRKVASAYKREGDLQSAVDCYMRIKVVAPEDSSVLYTLGMLYTELERYADAEEEFRAAVRHSYGSGDDSEDALFGLGEAGAKGGNLAGAELAFRKLATSNPENPEYGARLAEIYHRMGKFEDAIKYYLHSAHAFQLIEENGRAVSLYQRVLALDAGNSTAVRELTNLKAPVVADAGGVVVSQPGKSGGKSASGKKGGRARESVTAGGIRSGLVRRDGSSSRAGLAPKGGQKPMAGVGGKPVLGGGSVASGRPGLVRPGLVAAASGGGKPTLGEGKRMLRRSGRAAVEENAAHEVIEEVVEPEVETQVPVENEVVEQVAERHDTSHGVDRRSRRKDVVAEDWSEVAAKASQDEATYEPVASVAEADVDPSSFARAGQEQSAASVEPVEAELTPEPVVEEEEFRPTLRGVKAKVIDETLKDAPVSQTKVVEGVSEPDFVPSRESVAVVEHVSEPVKVSSAGLAMAAPGITVPEGELQIPAPVLFIANGNLIKAIREQVVEAPSNEIIPWLALPELDSALVSERSKQSEQAAESEAETAAGPVASSFGTSSGFSFESTGGIGGVTGGTRRRSDKVATSVRGSLLSNTTGSLADRIAKMRAKTQGGEEEQAGIVPGVSRDKVDTSAAPVKRTVRISGGEAAVVDEPSSSDESQGQVRSVGKSTARTRGAKGSAKLAKRIAEAKARAGEAEGRRLGAADVTEVSVAKEVVSEIAAAAAKAAVEAVQAQAQAQVQKAEPSMSSAGEASRTRQASSEEQPVVKAEPVRASAEQEAVSVVVPEAAEQPREDVVETGQAASVAVVEPVVEPSEVSQTVAEPVSAVVESAGPVSEDDLYGDGPAESSALDDLLYGSPVAAGAVMEGVAGASDQLGGPEPQVAAGSVESSSLVVEPVADVASHEAEAAAIVTDAQAEPVGEVALSQPEVSGKAELPEAAEVEAESARVSKPVVEPEVVAEPVSEVESAAEVVEPVELVEEVPAVEDIVESQSEVTEPTEQAAVTEPVDVAAVTPVIEPVVQPEVVTVAVEPGAEAFEDVSELPGGQAMSGAQPIDTLTTPAEAEPVAEQLVPSAAAQPDATVSSARSQSAVDATSSAGAKRQEQLSTSAAEAQYAISREVRVAAAPLCSLAVESEFPEVLVKEAKRMREKLAGADVTTAIGSYRRAVEDSPNNMVLRTDLADIHLRYGLLDDAVSQYKQILRKQPNSVALRHRLADAYLWNAEYEEAANTLLELADLHARHKQDDDTLDVLQTVLSLDPNHFVARRRLVNKFIELKHSDLAIHHLRQLAEASLTSGNVEVAISALKQLMQLSDEASVQERLAQVYESQGNVIEAMVYYRQLADRYRQAEAWNEATAALEKLVALDESNLEDRRSLVDLYQRLGRADLVLSGQFDLACKFKAQGNVRDAIELFELVIQKDSKFFEARRRLVDCYLEVGNLEGAKIQAEPLTERYQDEKLADQAIDLYTRLIAVEPDSISLRERLVGFYDMAKRNEDMLSQLLTIADLHESSEQYREAVDALRRAIVLAPERDDLHYRLACLYEDKLASLSGAMEELKLVYELNPAHCAGVERYAKLLMDRDKPKESAAVLTKLIGSNKEVGCAARDAIRAEYQERIGQDPTDWATRFKYGELCFSLGFIEDAVEQFQKTRQDRDYELRSYNMLGQAFIKNPRFGLDMAVRQFRRGLETKGHAEQDYLELRYNLAVLLYQNGRLQEALTELKDILAVDLTYRDVEKFVAKIQDEIVGKGTAKPRRHRPTPRRPS